MRSTEPRRLIAGLVTPATALILMAGVAAPALADTQTAAGPTAESALAAEQELARAFRENDADGISRMLADDWAVIPTNGAVGEGKSMFPEGIRTGVRTLKAYEISEPRVHVYGNAAVVTAKVTMSGVYNGKPFENIMERQTDVLVWNDGSWKVVLTHETMIKPG
jgi:ketosteroid isomerase-like protein